MSPVEVSNDGRIGWIRLNRPDRANALNVELVEALIEAVTGIIESPARILVLSGAGRSFCGGLDISNLDQEDDASLAFRILRIELLLQILQCAPLYTVVLSHGAIAGAGADLTAVCAKRIAAPGSSFRFPGIKFGVVLGTSRLLDLVGDRARGLILEQDKIKAEEALRIGLVSEIAELSDWESLVDDVASRIEQVPSAAVGSVMQLGMGARDRDLGVLARSVATPGLKERIQAYSKGLKSGREKLAES